MGRRPLVSPEELKHEIVVDDRFWLVRWYRWLYGETTPTFCRLFWGTLASVVPALVLGVLMPLWWPVLVGHRTVGRRRRAAADARAVLERVAREIEETERAREAERARERAERAAAIAREAAAERRRIEEAARIEAERERLEALSRAREARLSHKLLQNPRRALPIVRSHVEEAREARAQREAERVREREAIAAEDARRLAEVHRLAEEARARLRELERHHAEVLAQELRREEFVREAQARVARERRLERARLAEWRELPLSERIRLRRERQEFLAERPVVDPGELVDVPGVLHHQVAAMRRITTDGLDLIALWWARAILFRAEHRSVDVVLSAPSRTVTTSVALVRAARMRIFGILRAIGRGVRALGRLRRGLVDGAAALIEAGRRRTTAFVDAVAETAGSRAERRVATMRAARSVRRARRDVRAIGRGARALGRLRRGLVDVVAETVGSRAERRVATMRAARSVRRARRDERRRARGLGERAIRWALRWTAGFLALALGFAGAAWLVLGRFINDAEVAKTFETVASSQGDVPWESILAFAGLVAAVVVILGLMSIPIVRRATLRLLRVIAAPFLGAGRVILRAWGRARRLWEAISFVTRRGLGRATAGSWALFVECYRAVKTNTCPRIVVRDDAPLDAEV